MIVFNIKELMEQRQMNLYQLSKKTKISRTALKPIIDNKPKSFNIEFINKIAKELNVPESALFKIIENAEIPEINLLIGNYEISSSKTFFKIEFEHKNEIGILEIDAKMIDPSWRFSPDGNSAKVTYNISFNCSFKTPEKISEDIQSLYSSTNRKPKKLNSDSFLDSINSNLDILQNFLQSICEKLLLDIFPKFNFFEYSKDHQSDYNFLISFDNLAYLKINRSKNYSLNFLEYSPFIPEKKSIKLY